MKKTISIISFLFIALAYVNATHLVGGEMTYECLGGNQYEVTLKIYRDCGPGNTNNTGFDPQAEVAVYDANGTYIQGEFLTFPGANNIPVTLNNPCTQAPPNICVEEAVYQKTITLPPVPAGGYNLVYQRCCRNPTIINIKQPGDYGASYLAHIPEPVKAACNTAPYFIEFPPLVLCAGDSFFFDHAAFDADGDSLVYSFCDPYHGASPTNPAPSPPSAPPFSTILWENGYSTNYQIDANSALAIDPNTGFLAGTPQQQGQYVVGICVSEYRNGVLLNEHKRDFQFNVTICNPTIIAAVPSQTKFCDGYTVQFSENSTGATSYYWDFGDPTTTNDTSSLQNPIYTYQDSGVYTIMLIVNPSWPCADTTYVTYAIYPLLEPEAVLLVDSQCFVGNSYAFEAAGIYTDSATFYWDFGGNSIPLNSTEEFPSGIEYLDPGSYTATLYVYENNCVDSVLIPLTVLPNPEANFSVPEQSGCVPFTVDFNNSSTAGTSISYLWDFGNGETSLEQNPTHVYPNVGSYDVTLVIWTTEGCVDTSIITFSDLISVNPVPVAGFTVYPEVQSIFNPDFKFYNEALYNTDCQLFFDDGNSFSECGFTEYSYLDTGNYQVMQVVNNEFGCYDTAYQDIRVHPEYAFFAPNSFTPNGDGLNDGFRPIFMAGDNYELYIFDRWGQKIFETTDKEEEWLGTVNGGTDIAPNGTYVWQARLRNLEKNSNKKYTGIVSIVR